VIAAIARFAKPSGVVCTFILNFKGKTYQGLMKRENQKAYDAHVPYDATDLALAHEKAGLKIESCAYFLSSNFGMLSRYLAKLLKHGLTYQGYAWPTRFPRQG
jgi:hypothetical protein